MHLDDNLFQDQAAFSKLMQRLEKDWELRARTGLRTGPKASSYGKLIHMLDCWYIPIQLYMINVHIVKCAVQCT